MGEVLWNDIDIREEQKQRGGSEGTGNKTNKSTPSRGKCFAQSGDVQYILFVI